MNLIFKEIQGYIDRHQNFNRQSNNQIKKNAHTTFRMKNKIKNTLIIPLKILSTQ